MGFAVCVSALLPTTQHGISASELLEVGTQGALLFLGREPAVGCSVSAGTAQFLLVTLEAMLPSPRCISAAQGNW